MSALTQLPADQRAVIELMLARGRNYTEIARLLSIERRDVRQRALAAFEALGPKTDIDAEQRGLITDYLLGELPVGVRNDVRDRLAREPAERAWARVVASEVAPVAARPLPEIPVAQDERRGGAEGSDGGETPAHAPTEAPAAAQAGAAEGAVAASAGAAGAPVDPEGAPAPAAERPEAAATPAPGEPAADAPRRSSRRGGAIVLGLGALIVVAVVVVIFLVTSGGKNSAHTSSVATSRSAPTAGTTTSPPVLGTVKLTPTAAGSKAQGIAEAFAQSSKEYLAIVAVNLTPNNHNYYAVWLSSGPSQNVLLGFANPGVGSDGRLQAATLLQSTDSKYNRLLVTVETQGHPSAPGPVVLSGPFSLKPVPSAP